MKVTQSYYKNKIPDLGKIKKLDDELLELVGGIKYRNACKFLMLVKMYNNRNKKHNIFPWEDKPYSFFTREQAGEYIWVDARTISNIVSYLQEKWLLKVAKRCNLNVCNHVNFYLATIPTNIESKSLEKEIYQVEVVKVEEEIEIVIPEEKEYKWTYLEFEPIDFYKRISIKWTKIEVSDTQNVFDIDKSRPVMSIMEHDKCNVYFCWGVKQELKWRCKDEDIVMKSYFWVDIDIREDIKKKTWEVISDNQLFWYIDAIQERLDNSDYGDYEYIVSSGNWVHIYYIWEPNKFKPEVYSAWVKRIYRDIDVLIKDLWLKTDKTTSNISSLFRCPLTINYWREVKYWLDIWPCFIYDKKDSSGITFDSLENIGIQAISEKEQEIEERKKMVELAAKKRKKDFEGNDVFEDIRRIPVHELFTRHTWIRLAWDWKNFISNKDNKYIGCFYSEEKNKLINTWTHHLQSDETSYSTFDYVMKEMLLLSNSKESIKKTIEWFRDNYNI